MAVRARRKPIDPEKYARLIAASLPIPPRSEAQNDRLIELLSRMDEREDLTAEEKAFGELLAIAIEDFENKHYTLPPVPPHEALKALMEDRGLRHKDVWPGQWTVGHNIFLYRHPAGRADTVRLRR